MPVGNADKGVGLGAGEIMFTGDYIYQAIDWEHSPVGNEQFDHYGHLNSNIFNLGFTIGLNDYWNVSISQRNDVVLKCVDIYKEHYILVGTGNNKVYTLDQRTGRILNRFHGGKYGVQQIFAHSRNFYFILCFYLEW